MRIDSGSMRSRSSEMSTDPVTVTNEYGGAASSTVITARPSLRTVESTPVRVPADRNARRSSSDIEWAIASAYRRDLCERRVDGGHPPQRRKRRVANETAHPQVVEVAPQRRVEAVGVEHEHRLGVHAESG